MDDAAMKNALRQQRIETPSWGYGDSGRPPGLGSPRKDLP